MSKKKEKSGKRIDPLWHKALALHSSMVKHANGMRNTVRLFKRAAYRFTKVIMEIQENHHNELLDLVKSAGSDIEGWMEEHFEPVEMMGDNRRDLMANVKSGMTEEQYVAQFTSWGPRKRAAERPAPAKADTTTPRDKRSDSEKLADQGKLIAALKSENRELCRDNALLLADSKQLRAEFDRLEKWVDKHRVKSG